VQEQHLVGGGEQDDAELVSRVPRGMRVGWNTYLELMRSGGGGFLAFFSFGS